MLKLYGFATSHYFNKVKFALLEKGLPFEEVLVWAGEADLCSSPMGKVPYLVAPHGPLCESGVILDYLEQQYPQIPLVPVDAYQAAKIRELAVIIDLHIELVARSLYPEAFFGGTIADSTKEATAALLQKGIAAFKQLAQFGPFVAGDMLSLADCSAVMHLPVVAAACKAIYGTDFLADLPIDDYLRHMAERPSLQKIHADRLANMAMLYARKHAKR
jgi:glutathione S-transferase